MPCAASSLDTCPLYCTTEICVLDNGTQHSDTSTITQVMLMMCCLCSAQSLHKYAQTTHLHRKQHNKPSIHWLLQSQTPCFDLHGAQQVVLPARYAHKLEQYILDNCKQLWHKHKLLLYNVKEAYHMLRWQQDCHGCKHAVSLFCVPVRHKVVSLLIQQQLVKLSLHNCSSVYPKLCSDS